MSRFVALLQLLANLVRGALRSGLQAGQIILLRPGRVQSGFIWLDYADLGEGGASLLAALITLTPGTTAVAVDPKRRALRLHLLDIDQAEATTAEIRRDLIGPLQRLGGGKA